MQIKEDKPRLLMVCHCLPSCSGDDRQRRVWQLLSTAATTHRVWLALLTDGPVHYGQWHALAHSASELAMVEHRSLRPRHQLAKQISQWQVDHQFHTVLCSCPRLWPIARQTQAGMRICDFFATDNRARHQRRHQQIEADVAGECDAVIVGEQRNLLRLACFAKKVHLVTAHNAETLTQLLRPPAHRDMPGPAGRDDLDPTMRQAA